MGLATVAEIGKERIRRVIARMKAEREGQLELEQPETPEDLGFRVFKLAPSHYRHWRDYDGDSLQALQGQLSAFQSPLVEGWVPADLRVEIMLQEGFPLDSQVVRAPTLPDNAVDVVASDACAHRLWVCLDARLAPETVAALARAETGLGPQDVFVCLDSALTDELKVRLDDRLNVKVI